MGGVAALAGPVSAVLLVVEVASGAGLDFSRASFSDLSNMAAGRSSLSGESVGEPG